MLGFIGEKKGEPRRKEKASPTPTTTT